MTIIQIFISVFALFAISRVIVQFRKGGLTIALMLFWALFWLAAIGITMSPQTTDVFARLVGVGRGADFVIYVSLVAIFYLIFRVYIKIESVEQDITKLVRKLALEESGVEK